MQYTVALNRARPVRWINSVIDLLARRRSAKQIDLRCNSIYDGFYPSLILGVVQ